MKNIFGQPYLKSGSVLRCKSSDPIFDQFVDISFIEIETTPDTHVFAVVDVSGYKAGTAFSHLPRECLCGENRNISTQWLLNNWNTYLGKELVLLSDGVFRDPQVATNGRLYPRRFVRKNGDLLSKDEALGRGTVFRCSKVIGEDTHVDDYILLDLNYSIYQNPFAEMAYVFPNLELSSAVHQNHFSIYRCSGELSGTIYNTVPDDACLKGTKMLSRNWLAQNWKMVFEGYDVIDARYLDYYPSPKMQLGNSHFTVSN